MPIPGKRQALRSGSAEVSPASPVRLTFVYDTKTSATVCGGLHGGLKGPAAGGPTDREPVVDPFRTGKEPVLLTCPVTDCLFVAFGWLPPPLMQAYVAFAVADRVIASVDTVLPSPASLKSWT